MICVAFATTANAHPEQTEAYSVTPTQHPEQFGLVHPHFPAGRGRYIISNIGREHHHNDEN